MIKILIDKFKVNEFNIISLFQQLNMMAMFGYRKLQEKENKNQPINKNNFFINQLLSSSCFTICFFNIFPMISKYKKTIFI